MSDIYKYSDDELQKLGDIIIWTTIYAALHNDGIINPSERAVAVKQTHVRSFSSEDYLLPIYKHLDTHFERDFDKYVSELSGTVEEQEAHIQEKIKDATAILPVIGPLFSERFVQDLEKLYSTVFRANSSIFQVFMLPVLTSRLNKFERS